MLKNILHIFLLIPFLIFAQEEDQNGDASEDSFTNDEYFFANFEIEKRANFVFTSLKDYKEGVELSSALTIEVLANKNYIITFSSNGKNYFESSSGSEMPVSSLSARSNGKSWQNLSPDGVILMKDPHCYNKNEKRHPSANRDCYHPQLKEYMPCRQYVVDYKVALPQVYSDGTYTIEMTYVISRP